MAADEAALAWDDEASEVSVLLPSFAPPSEIEALRVADDLSQTVGGGELPEEDGAALAPGTSVEPSPGVPDEVGGVPVSAPPAGPSWPTPEDDPLSDATAETAKALVRTAKDANRWLDVSVQLKGEGIPLNVTRLSQSQADRMIEVIANDTAPSDE